MNQQLVEMPKFFFTIILFSTNTVALMKYELKFDYAVLIKPPNMMALAVSAVAIVGVRRNHLCPGDQYKRNSSTIITSSTITSSTKSSISTTIHSSIQNLKNNFLKFHEIRTWVSNILTFLS
eukprot:GFUD01002778.1.p1 GENE.GFUD01002778.1~~GFUD01002778.1.p1  ORF type:complete len:122 (-),score=25.89 GFUD01002778.1:142-507(-)